MLEHHFRMVCLFLDGRWSFLLVINFFNWLSNHLHFFSVFSFKPSFGHECSVQLIDIIIIWVNRQFVGSRMIRHRLCPSLLFVLIDENQSRWMQTRTWIRLDRSFLHFPTLLVRSFSMIACMLRKKVKWFPLAISDWASHPSVFLTMSTFESFTTFCTCIIFLICTQFCSLFSQLKKIYSPIALNANRIGKHRNCIIELVCMIFSK